MSKSLAVVVGAGEGLGNSLIKVLSMSGYQVVALNRSVNREADAINKNRALTKQVDVSDSKLLQSVLNEIVQEFGAPSVVIHNPAQLHIKPFLETSVEDFELAWKSMVLSAINVLHTVIPGMLQQGCGKIIVSGATGSIRGGANFSAFASAKFALRGLTQSLAREYQKQGVHIAHVILDGILDTSRSRELHSLDPSEMMSTTDVAEAYLQLIQQPPSAWTHELDLRPQSETF
ncbi:MAG: SDR family NAD(P)-dependent oxidoreductase [Gammaproteobacteria bacterium]